MEILIVVAIMAVVTKRGVEDILHTARGGTPHRYTAARTGGKSGAWGRYWRTLSDDVAGDLLERHNARRVAADVKPDRPRGAATQFFAGLTQDARRAARRRWNAGWDGLDERRRTKATRPRPGQVTVPGTIVPNAQDESQDEDGRPEDGIQDGPEDGPQDEDRPDPAAVPTQDDRTDLQFGDDPTDPTGTKTCPECHGTSITQDGICLACRDRQEQRNQHYEDGTRDTWKVLLPNGNTIVTDHPEVYQYRGYPTEKVRGRDHQQGFLVTDPTTAAPTQEGTTMTTTIPTGEVAGLSDAIRFSDASALAFRAQAIATEQTVAALAAGGVTGPAAASFAAAMEKSEAAAMDMDAATAELKSHLAVQEAYNANKGAGTREFVTAGQ